MVEKWSQQRPSLKSSRPFLSRGRGPRLFQRTVAALLGGSLVGRWVALSKPRASSSHLDRECWTRGNLGRRTDTPRVRARAHQHSLLVIVWKAKLLVVAFSKAFGRVFCGNDSVSISLEGHFWERTGILRVSLVSRRWVWNGEYFWLGREKDVGILYLMAEQSSNRRLTSRRCLEKIVGLFLLFISLRFLGNWRNCNRNTGCLNQ